MIGIFPVALKRDLSSLNYISLIGLVAIFYILLVILIETPLYIKHYWPAEHLSFHQITLVKLDINLLISFTINLFSFTCCQVVFEIRSELNDNTLNRTFKVFNRSVIIETILYLLLGNTFIFISYSYHIHIIFISYSYSYCICICIYIIVIGLIIYYRMLRLYVDP